MNKNSKKTFIDSKICFVFLNSKFIENSNKTSILQNWILKKKINLNLGFTAKCFDCGNDSK